MAIKRVEVFARQYRARIISITNEQAELIEHSTRGDACEGKGREIKKEWEKESLLITCSLLPPLASSTPRFEIDAICFNPMVLAATLEARRRSAARQTSGIFADARTYLRGIKKSSALPSEDILRGAFLPSPIVSKRWLNGIG